MPAPLLRGPASAPYFHPFFNFSDSVVPLRGGVGPNYKSLDNMGIAMDGVPVHKFKTEDHISSGIANSEGKRHLEEHKGPSCKKTKL